MHLRMGSQRSVLSQVRFGLSPRLEGISEVLFCVPICAHHHQIKGTKMGTTSQCTCLTLDILQRMIACVHIVCSIATETKC